MAKISEPSDGNLDSLPSATPANNERVSVTHQGRQIAIDDSSTSVISAQQAASSKGLSERSIEPLLNDQLDMVAQLAYNKQWAGLSSAIELHGQDKSSLQQLLSVLQPSLTVIPSAIQQQIAMQFTACESTEKLSILTAMLPQAPLEALGVCVEWMAQPDDHDSLLGFLARESVDNLLLSLDLPQVDRTELVNSMVQALHDALSDKMYLLENQLLQTEADPTVQQSIEQARTERRLDKQMINSTLVTS